jgi:hypothetical protein
LCSEHHNDQFWKAPGPHEYPIPLDKPVILLVEHFDQIDPHMQREYAHLVDGDPVPYALAPGSLLLLHVDPQGRDRLEFGTMDRGFWLSVPAAI